MLKVYISSPYSLKETVRKEAAELTALGIECVSSWILEPHSPTAPMSDLSPEQARTYAVQDVKDVESADVFVFHNDLTGKIIRAGRVVEMGVAISRGIPILVVGTAFENIFHWLPQVTHFSEWSLVVTELLALSKSIPEREKLRREFKARLDKSPVSVATWRWVISHPMANAEEKEKARVSLYQREAGTQNAPK